MARPNLAGHRKFRRLTRTLDGAYPGLGRALARGYLELMWDSCYESGDEYVGTADDLENLVGWTGERGMLTRALLDAGAPEGVGFLDAVDGTSFRVHDLWHHAPDYVAKRRRRELERHGKFDPGSVVGRTAPNGAEKRQVSPRLAEVGGTPAPAPAPAPAHEEISAEAEEHASTQPAPPFLEFPAIGPEPEWALSETQVVEWERLYPVVDVRAETRKALAWLQANPGRRKTARGMARFLVNWLSRAVDDGRGVRPRRPKDVAAQRHEWTCPHEPKCLGRHACHVKQLITKGRAS